MQREERVIREMMASDFMGIGGDGEQSEPLWLFRSSFRRVLVSDSDPSSTEALALMMAPRWDFLVSDGLVWELVGTNSIGVRFQAVEPRRSIGSF